MKYLYHKTKLYPNKEAIKYLNKACGIARFAYNWGLSERSNIVLEQLGMKQEINLSFEGQV